MTNPNATIIIVNYNGMPFLRDCILSIMSTEAGASEIIIVDNASTDGSCDSVTAEFPRVKAIKLDQNYGFARANNIGAEAAAGAYIVFLNNDTAVSPGWFTALHDAVSSDPTIGVAGSKLLFYNMPDKVNSAGMNIVFNGAGYDIGYMDTDSGKYSIPDYKGAVCGAAMMVRKTEFLSFGGFDPDYFLYGEDTDLCWRYWLYGRKVAYVPSSIVYHKFGGTTGASRHAPLRILYGARNSLMSIIKNYEPRNILVPLLFSLLYHAARFFYYLLTLRPYSAFFMVRAYGSFFKLFPGTMAKRREIQKRRKICDKDLFENSRIISLRVSLKEFLRLLRI